MSSGRLSRQDWIRVALLAMARNGLSGIAVEPLAKELGATKGSFYWHFRNRGELVTATLESWEKASTEAIIETLRPLSDPRERLRHLLQMLFLDHQGPSGSPPLQPGTSNRAIDTSIALNAGQDNPVVADVIARVTARRVAYVAGELVALGIPRQEAQRRSLFAYTAYLGHAALSRGAPDAIPRAAKGQKFVDSALAMLLT